nr:hypothetical protein [Acinetobacter sp. Marseille-Q1620]
MFKMFLIGLIILGSTIVFVACYPDNKKQDYPYEFPNKIVEKQFALWYEKQDKNKITEYQNYVEKYVKRVPSIFELTYNQTNNLKNCEKYQFNIPPKEYWKNIIGTLQMVEKLQENGLFEQYRIISSYHPDLESACFSHSPISPHMHNQSIDIQVLDENHQPYMNKTLIMNKMCLFWRKEGRELRMGLGIYDQDIFHIDTLGHRTWGTGHSLQRSPCYTFK